MSVAINYYRPSHKGIMPIRVLQHNLLNEFVHMNKDFEKLAKEVIDKMGADPGIRYDANEESVKSPFVLYNKINVNESFLSYVWCNCYSLLVLYEEIISKSSYNELHGGERKQIYMEHARNAYKLWEYGIGLITEYKEWDKNLPNPELVLPILDDVTSVTNALYLVAMTFVLAHEFAHIELGHTVPSVENEKEADARAIDLVLQGVNEKNEATKRFGVLMGLCSLLFFKGTIKSQHYPDVDDRIDAIITRFNPEPGDGMWGIATLAYKLWDRMYNLGLEFKEGLDSPKDQYYDIKQQVKDKFSK